MPFLYLQITALPNGEMANFAKRKCIFPNGIPMMVIQRMKPQKACVRHIQIPAMKNQKMFMKVLRQPGCDCIHSTFVPNGHKARMPSFILCRPKGIPIIVIIRINPATKYSSAMFKPPKMSQMMFPNSFIILNFKSLQLLDVWNGRKVAPNMLLLELFCMTLYSKDVGLEPRPQDEGAACSIDGRGC